MNEADRTRCRRKSRREFLKFSGTGAVANAFAATGGPVKLFAMAAENLVWEYRQIEPNPYDVEWQLLFDAIRQNEPHNESRRAAEADLVALMCRMATDSGVCLTWDETMNSNYQFVSNIDGMTMATPAPIHSDADGMYAAAQPGVTKEY